MGSDGCLKKSDSSFDCAGLNKVCQNAVCVEPVCNEIQDCGEWSQCLAGNQTRICSNSLCKTTQSCGLPCNEATECGSWSECMNNIKTRSCTNPSCEVSQVCALCEENWKCEWSSCQEGDEFSYAYDCVDSNNCNTVENKPDKVECGMQPMLQEELEKECDSRFECGSWGECEADYTFEDVLEEKITVDGVKRRSCTDLNRCRRDKTEKIPCKLSIPIEVKKVEWCFEDYVEIYDKNTNTLVSRMKESEISEESNLNRIDISFVAAEGKGNCDYCFNKIKDYDEEEVDCGGQYCNKCAKEAEFIDVKTPAAITLWAVLGMLLLGMLKGAFTKAKILVILHTMSYIFKPKTAKEAKISEEKIIRFLRRIKEYIFGR